MSPSEPPVKWWKEATGYQIWPASYKDSNDDGLGDLPGITSTLDYLSDLGVDFIWLSPVYDSPQADMGYDVADYEKIWSKYGSLDDMDTLIRKAKERKIKVVMDLVINHSSSEHKWFLESKKSKDNPYSDWYIWRDPKYDKNGNRKEPSNWRAAFGGSVWTYVPERDQYYMHLCLPQQPDLNWQNPETRNAIYKSAVDFWLARGIDGFRIDACNFYWKDPAFPDSKIVLPSEKYQPMEPQHIINGPEVHTWLKELRSKIRNDHGEDIVLIGELPGTGREQVLKYTLPSSGELDMVFDFDIFMAGNDWNAKLHDLRLPKLSEVKQTLIKTQGILDCAKDAWTTVFIENHDNIRSVCRFGPGEGPHHEAAAKMLALFASTLSGTLFVYQGQEIGMTNMPQHWDRKDLRDKAVLRYLDELSADHPGDDEMLQRGLDAAHNFGRDNGRTPVQWTSEAYGGFSSVESWIGVNDNYKTINVSDQLARSDSPLHFWMQALKLRKQYKDLLVYGKFELFNSEDEQVCMYVKRSTDMEEKMLVVLNFTSDSVQFSVPTGLDALKLKLVISTSTPDDTAQLATKLQPWEGRLYACT
ncbi:glycoside hydrolase family 13 protein [Acrodontium crateriforme]|uniref:Glycoside hydrolase family 13 protein n=1 Tax=Acrodontium crateriforme TaxID=150365 RepID=A0AAQ3M3G8_9PEZI|nr:glycoside hydrolase family 13 protein [Acrodontium crateriforme]